MCIPMWFKSILELVEFCIVLSFLVEQSKFGAFIALNLKLQKKKKIIKVADSFCLSLTSQHFHFTCGGTAPSSLI